MNFFFSISLWFFFGAIHSFMARPFFKRIVVNTFGKIFEKYFYRFFYFVTQCILFNFIYGVIKNLNHGLVLFRIPEEYYYYYFIFYVISNLFLIISILNYDVAEFTGVKQIYSYFFKKKSLDQKLITKKFFYKFIRHPMYFGIIIVYISSHTIFTQLFFVNMLCIIAYIEIGSFYEEKTLLKMYGSVYVKYKKKTKSYLPFIR